MSLEPAIIIDMDGTLAHIEERREVLRETGNHDKFSEGILEKDKLNLWCKQIIDKFKDDHKILIVTGRRGTEKIKEETLKWLKTHEVQYDNIFFRPEFSEKGRDTRPDNLVKKEIFEREIKKRYEILFVVDDRSTVVKMWREEGLVCLQCDWGDF